MEFKFILLYGNVMVNFNAFMQSLREVVASDLILLSSAHQAAYIGKEASGRVQQLFSEPICKANRVKLVVTEPP